MSFNAQHLSANYSTLVAPRKNGSSLSIASFPDDDITKEDSCLWVQRRSEDSLSIASFLDDKASENDQTKWSTGHWTENIGNRIMPVLARLFKTQYW